jgi:hypothetical protein
VFTTAIQLEGTEKFLKVARSTTFKNFSGFYISAKRCSDNLEKINFMTLNLLIGDAVKTPVQMNKPSHKGKIKCLIILRKSLRSLV